jgi:DNA-directed RNA polymerase subunit alpha
LKIRPLQMPKRVKVDKDNLSETYGKFVVSPLERGFGLTIGNALRRVLLSSIQGAAITSIKFEGVLHEFTTIQGVLEDVPQILLNLKKVRFRMLGDAPKIVNIKITDKNEVTAADIETDGNIEVINPDLHIATLTDDSVFDATLKVDVGRGYVPAEQLKDRKQPIGTIALDAMFSPVTRVNHSIENTRVGQRTDYDKLILEIWTDGTVTPEGALSHAAKIIKDHMLLFIIFEEEPEEEPAQEVDEETERIRKLLNTSVEELELSVRSSNCLKQADIVTLADLVQKTESEMLKYRNFGKKSLAELVNILKGHGLSFGMDVSKYITKDRKKEDDDF